MDTIVKNSEDLDIGLVASDAKWHHIGDSSEVQRVVNLLGSASTLYLDRMSFQEWSKAPEYDVHRADTGKSQLPLLVINHNQARYIFDLAVLPKASRSLIVNLLSKKELVLASGLEADYLARIQSQCRPFSVYEFLFVWVIVKAELLRKQFRNTTQLAHSGKIT